MASEEITVLKKELKAGIEAAKKKIATGELYDRLSAMQKAGSLPRSLFRDFGWFVYYRLRVTPLSHVLSRKRMLMQYLNLELVCPSLLHSLMLLEAIKLKKNSPSQFRLRDFLKLWGEENLREEDWEKFKPEKGHSPNSLVENLIGAYTKEVKKDKCEASEEFARVLDTALQTYKANPHLPLYKAITLVSQGKKKEALEYYRILLRRWPKKFFLWSNAEEVVPYHDLDLRISFLSKAVATTRNPRFLGDIKLRLANLLLKKGLYANARYELEQYERYYTGQGWHVKKWCETLQTRLDAAAPEIPSSPTPYNSLLIPADNFIKS